MTTATTPPTIAPTFTWLTGPKFDAFGEIVGVGVEEEEEGEAIDVEVANVIESVFVVNVLELVLIVERDLLCVDVYL